MKRFLRRFLIDNFYDELRTIVPKKAAIVGVSAEMADYCTLQAMQSYPQVYFLLK